MNKEDLDTQQCSIAEDDEISLVELFLVIWKRKWMIVAVTLMLTVAATGISFVMPKVYQVTAILEPGKDAEGKLVDNPQAIRENILGGAYNRIIAEEMNIPLKVFPEFKATVPRATDLVKISVETANPESGVKILNRLLALISEYLQDRLEIKIKQTKNYVKIGELKGQNLDNQIKLFEKQIVQTENKMVDLENASKKAIASRSENTMAVYLYSNDIYNKQIYLNNLQIERTNLIDQKERNLIDIEDAKLKVQAIKGTNIAKYPSVPEKTIRPKKVLIVVLAFIFGLMGSTMLAFFAEFINKIQEHMVIANKPHQLSTLK